MRHARRYHVAPGTSYVGGNSEMSLTAALGTCVGVAIYDSEHGVGGLLHLLLDVPPDPSQVVEPAKYASTGVPLFLEKLRAAGATGELRACIAGGAIVGPLSSGDVLFDVGGKTADCVKTILTEENIELVHSETEGFFTCVMSLNLGDGQCQVEPAGFETAVDVQPCSTPSKEDILSSIDQLKPIPQTALKILRLTCDENVDFSAIVQELKKDQVLGARTLHICNSAQFGTLHNITSLDHALSYLGQNNLIRFVIVAAVELFFGQDAMGYSLCKGGLYHHASGTAVIAENIALRTDAVEAQTAYVAGLLHDIGKIVLDQHIQAIKPLFYRELHQSGSRDLEVEQELLGLDHCQAGLLLAERWSLPGPLASVIGSHHNPSRATVSPELVAIVYLADLLKSGFHPGLEVQKYCTDELGSVLKTLGLTSSHIPRLIDDIPLNSLTGPESESP